MSTELQRVEFRIIVTDRDDDGLIIGERQLAEGVAFPSALDNLTTGIRDAVANATTPDDSQVD